MNNGELTFKKTLEKVTHLNPKASTPHELSEYCTAVAHLDTLIDEAVESMEWMVKQLKWKHRLQLDMESEVLYPDAVINWSPEMIKAMKILDELKGQ